LTDPKGSEKEKIGKTHLSARKTQKNEENFHFCSKKRPQILSAVFLPILKTALKNNPSLS